MEVDKQLLTTLAFRESLYIPDSHHSQGQFLLASLNSMNGSAHRCRLGSRCQSTCSRRQGSSLASSDPRLRSVDLEQLLPKISSAKPFASRQAFRRDQKSCRSRILQIIRWFLGMRYIGVKYSAPKENRIWPSHIYRLRNAYALKQRSWTMMAHLCNAFCVSQTTSL